MIRRSWSTACKLLVRASSRNPVELSPQVHKRQYAKGKLSVILTSEVAGLGAPGQLVQVPPGFMRNKLLPQRQAVPDISKYRHLLRQQQQLDQEAFTKESGATTVQEEKKTTSAQRLLSEEDVLEGAKRMAARLEAGRLSIRGDTGHRSSTLRRPVQPQQIVAEVKRQLGVVLTEAHLDVRPLPFTEIGEYEIPLKLPAAIPLPGDKVSINLKVKVRRK
eukprot:TRINITY_DN10537_c0_g1_i1.p1 TRINITY_DN10537_c0_g1~~TRINITY_DN10537_c0_g1_i1.p1  ORF type:complete len:219 (-),score=49.32 TRINITY_DN10537_c0_g1_i1:591-1247(-)